MRGLSAQIMRGVGDHADVDAVPVMRVEKVLEHHGAAALAPFGATLAVEGAEIVGGFFRSIDVGVPVDDHARAPFVRTCSRPLTAASFVARMSEARSGGVARISLFAHAGYRAEKRWDEIARNIQ